MESGGRALRTGRSLVGVARAGEGLLRYVSEVPAICWRFAYIIDLPSMK
jgi:hypothetical protein